MKHKKTIKIIMKTKKYYKPKLNKTKQSKS